MRLFVGLRPPPAIRDQLLDTMDGVPPARWQDEEQLHVTLRFVGEIERPAAEDLAAALANVHAPAPAVALAGVGGFAHKGRTDTLWAALDPHDALAALHRKVDHACVGVGLPPERRAYLPHITLARLPRSAGADPSIAGWIGRHAGLASAAFTLPHLILYRSTLHADGAAYEALARWPLMREG
ncbi:MAG TPA: RNA 2',3'-cyclic phosphodiesterase [Sphingomonas sp.]|jgi:2'-5' RNA ligase|nr:RNA 2',3'-cyclic phosphodiesterase [Sphingomonas sp.]